MYSLKAVRLTRLLCLTAKICVVFATSLPLCAQLSSERFDELLKLYQKGERKDLHSLLIAVSGMESYAERGGDTSKQLAITQAINLAATVLDTRDVTVPVDRLISRYPEYDGKDFSDKKLLFAGADPESIEDPVVRSRYKSALAEREKLIARVNHEREKEATANYALEFVQRMIETSRDKETAAKTASNAIESLSAAAWIKDYEKAKVFPPKTADDSRTEIVTPVKVAPPQVPVPKRTSAAPTQLSPKKMQQKPIQEELPISAPRQPSSISVGRLVAGVIAVLCLFGFLIWFLRRK
ncbi:MAG: hypothetical protein WA117_02140 [Verrucomicrobiia bacterium]